MKKYIFTLKTHLKHIYKIPRSEQPTKTWFKHQNENNVTNSMYIHEIKSLKLTTGKPQATIKSDLKHQI